MRGYLRELTAAYRFIAGAIIAYLIGWLLSGDRHMAEWEDAVLLVFTIMVVSGQIVVVLMEVEIKKLFK